ncbi:hypothetical protein KC319_g20189, partial [Hortaea werneckii]
PAAATVAVCPNSNGQLYEDDYGALYIINCGAYNTGTNYTILWSRDSGCTTLRCCMDYCDGFQDCFGTALLLGSNNNNCTFFYPPNGTHYANSAYKIAYQYRAASQPTVTYTTVSYATATQTSYLTQTTTSVGTLTSTAVSSYYTTVVNTVTTSYVQTTTQNLPGTTVTSTQPASTNTATFTQPATNDAAARNDDPADYISIYVSYHGNVDRTNHGDVY